MAALHVNILVLACLNYGIHGHRRRIFATRDLQFLEDDEVMLASRALSSTLLANLPTVGRSSQHLHLPSVAFARLDRVRAPVRLSLDNGTRYDFIECIMKSNSSDEAAVVETCRREARAAMEMDPTDPVLQDFDECLVTAGDNTTEIVQCYMSAVKLDREEARKITSRKKWWKRLWQKKTNSSIASLGAAGGLTYWNVKMLKHTILTFLSWYVVSVRTGLSPRLQWQKFLSYYASFYVSSAALQPIKIAAIFLLAPKVDDTLSRLATRLSLDKKLATLMAFFISTVFGGAVYSSSIVLASALSRIPV